MRGSNEAFVVRWASGGLAGALSLNSVVASESQNVLVSYNDVFFCLFVCLLEELSS